MLYKNKYGIYVKPGAVNNTFISNAFLDNDIAASDSGNNSWSSSEKAEGLDKLAELLDAPAPAADSPATPGGAP